MIVTFAVVLALIFLRGFSMAMGIPSRTFGLLGLVNYEGVLKLDKSIFHFVSTILPYFEITCVSAIFYTVCYALIVLKGDKHER